MYDLEFWSFPGTGFYVDVLHPDDPTKSIKGARDSSNFCKGQTLIGWVKFRLLDEVPSIKPELA